MAAIPPAMHPQNNARRTTGRIGVLEVHGPTMRILWRDALEMPL
jgi:hypothetical protein